MTDKPLDCVGTNGPVGKHDFQPVAEPKKAPSPSPTDRHVLPDKIYAWNYVGCFNTGLGLPVVDMGDTPWDVYIRAEPVEDLLRQAREALIKSRAYAIGGKDKDVISLNAVTAIDEFLREDK